MEISNIDISKEGVLVPATVTPVRYPGGKTKLYSFVQELLKANDLLSGTYCEPFAGGAGLALKLLVKKDVSRIIINDADPAIYSVWDMILNNTDEICDFIKTVKLTVAEWERQRSIYNAHSGEPGKELAKATFFLNRTNISGVITGGMIGGKSQQGKFKIDARFNRENLISKIHNIAELANKIELYNYDVLDFMDIIIPRLHRKALVNFDPPYVKKGGLLYRNSFTEADHKVLHDRIATCQAKWIVTYDVCDFIKELYRDFSGDYIDVYYSAKITRKAKEFIFYSDDLVIPKK